MAEISDAKPISNGSTKYKANNVVKLLNAQTAASDTSYKRPTRTLQDKLSYEEIKEKLKNYEKVTNLAEIPLYTHLRYIEVKEVNGKKEYKFRLGGYLINNKNLDKYIVLSNGRLKWSVQIANTIFYKSLKKNEELEEVDVNILKEEIKKLKEIIIAKELEINKLKEKMKEKKKKK